MLLMGYLGVVSLLDVEARLDVVGEQVDGNLVVRPLAR